MRRVTFAAPSESDVGTTQITLSCSWPSALPKHHAEERVWERRFQRQSLQTGNLMRPLWCSTIGFSIRLVDHLICTLPRHAKCPRCSREPGPALGLSSHHPITTSLEKFPRKTHLEHPGAFIYINIYNIYIYICIINLLPVGLVAGIYGWFPKGLFPKSCTHRNSMGARF